MSRAALQPLESLLVTRYNTCVCVSIGERERTFVYRRHAEKNKNTLYFSCLPPFSLSLVVFILFHFILFFRGCLVSLFYFFFKLQIDDPSLS
jgi:hypothetical protein